MYTTKRRTLLRVAAVALMALTGLNAAHAQEYPDRPLTVLVGYKAGGQTDLVARGVAGSVRPAWCSGQCGEQTRRRWYSGSARASEGKTGRLYDPVSFQQCDQHRAFHDEAGDVHAGRFRIRGHDHRLSGVAGNAKRRALRYACGIRRLGKRESRFQLWIT